MKKYLFLLFTLLFVLIPKSYALSNYDTFYSFDIPDNLYDDLSNYTYNDYNLKDLTDLLVELNNNFDDYYNILITLSYSNSILQSYYVELLPSSNLNSIDLSYYASGSFVGISGSLYNVSSRYFYLNYSNTNHNWNLLSSNWYNNLSNCLKTGVCTYTASNSTYGTYANSSSFFPNYGLYNGFIDSDNPSNDLSYNVTINSYYLYSHNIIFKTNYFNNTENGVYFKKIKLNDDLLDNDDIIPSFYDLYYNNTSNIIPSTSIGNIYIGQIPKDNISDFKFTSTFYYTDYNYVNSLQPRILFFGRVPHTGYYSYDQINCSSDIINTTAINQETKKATFTLLPNGFTCSSDLSNYDNIYMRVYFLNSSANTEILGFNGSSNYGKYYRLSDTLATSINAYIYEYYDSLPNDFSFVLSTLSDEIKAYYLTDSSYVGSVHINKDNNKLDSIIYNPISYGTANNKNVMIYNMSNYYDGLTHLDLFLNYNTIISSIDSSTGNYTYYNNTGVLTTDTIINNHTLVYDDSYDTSYYNNIVSGFIDSLSLDIDNFSSLVQQAYNLAPPFLQLFIYSVFILFCLYMLYKLIKRW